MKRPTIRMAVEEETHLTWALLNTQSGTYTQQYAIGRVNLVLHSSYKFIGDLEKPCKPHKFCNVRIMLMHVLLSIFL